MQVRQKCAVFARVPAKDVQQTGDRIGLRAIYGRGDHPSCSLAVIEPEHGANFLVNLQLMEIGCLLGPAYAPGDAANEIAFVRAIPCSGPDLDEQEPAKRGG